jgi:hypothetical protein
MTVPRKSAPRVSCQMTDLDVLEGLQEIFGGSIYRAHNPRPGSWKQSWVWNVVGVRAARVMESILPLMKSRRTARIREVLTVWNGAENDRAAKWAAGCMAGAAYLAGNGSLRTVASQFGVSAETVRQQALRLKGS